ncbi:MAG: APC family permease [Acidobacteria bacterium]|nr:APC family permease [Acidobacteriota bacterium]
MAVSSVAPAYSLASTIQAVIAVAGVGLVAPSVLIASFVPVMFVALSYFHLNRRNPNCGASYSWLAQVVNPYFGWINGWVQVGASVLFCTTAPLLAGGYTLQFLHSAFNAVPESALNSTVWTAWIAAGWLAFVTWICIVGIRWTTNAQWVMVLIEYTVVIVFSIGGIIKVLLRHPAHSLSFSPGWLDPFHIHGLSALAPGLALGVFFFWGWDTALNLNEESKEASRIPGRAGLISMWLLLFVFLLNIVAVEMLLGPAAINAQGTGVLFYFGQQFAGPWASYVMIFAVLSSTVATTQTTVLPAARITLSMARDGVFPKVFAKVSPRFQTPVIGTLLVSGFSMAGIFLTTVSSSANSVFNNLVLNIGVLVAFYYGVTGLACAWAFRRTWGTSLRSTMAMIVAPLIGGLVLLYVCYDVIKAGGKTALPDVIVLVSSVPFVILTWWVTKGKTTFFKQPLVAYDTID